VGNPLAKATAIAVWAGYSLAFCVIASSGRLDGSGYLLLLYPPTVLLGLLVPRWWVVVLPALLTVVLGRLGYEVACPCTEDTLAFFYAIWTIIFAAPGTVLLIATVELRRGLDRWRRGSAEPPAAAV
jgi:hypothetical protein